MATLGLPTVTLCAATSVNVHATLEALCTCLDQIEFAECLLFTDKDIDLRRPGIKAVRIEPLRSSHDYSHFLLCGLADQLNTDHCLIVQWDGFVLNPDRWKPRFLNFDYIGAPWPQFGDGHDVGNGGFSLRSRRLLEACSDPRFQMGHPEDVAICRKNRAFLEAEHRIRFADRETAADFAFERAGAGHGAFGFHGIFNMISAVGADRFWEIYESLDDPRTAFVDYGLLLRQLGQGPDGTRRRLRLTVDRMKTLFGA